MFKICRMGMVFLKNSKMLTFSAFLSIFFACFLSISMFQLSTSAEEAFEQNVSKEKGDFDIQVSKESGEAFTKEEMESLRRNKGVTKTTKGYWTVELEDTYIVGVVDDDINKSLYKYSENLKGNSIVINAPLSRRVEKQAGEVLSIGGKDFQICQVLEDDPMAGNKMPMVIMELTQLHKLLGNQDTGQANYMLLQCEDGVRRDVIVERIQEYNKGFQAYDSKMNEEFERLLTIVKSMLTTLFVIVVIVSGLFILSIFQEYMRKYRKDMAVIRTVGGKQWQVSAIFFSMSLVISTFGCLVGAGASALFSGVLLNWFNEKIQLFSGTVVINWQVLWQMVLTVFVLFNGFVLLVFSFGQRVLPIQVFQETSTGIRKKKKGNRFLGLRKLFGTEGYLGIKLMLPKFWQNIMIIFIIGLITTLAYTGQASMKLLEANNTSYYYGLMQGKSAYGEINTESPMLLSCVQHLDKRFQSATDSHDIIFGEFTVDSNENESIRSFMTTDLEELPKMISMEVWEKWGSVPKNKRIILEESTVKQKDCQLGDTINIASDWLGGTKEFILVGILAEDTFYGLDHSAILDWDNLCQSEQQEDWNDGCWVGLYLDGDAEKIKEKFFQLEQEYRDFQWYIYEDIMEQSEKISGQRMAMIEVVMFILLLVAGIGWLNSAKGMLMARKEEYRVLRMLGATVKRVRRISWIQVWSYMVSGIILGVILGIVVVYFLWRSNLNANVSISIYWENVMGIVIYLFILSLLLKPTIDKDYSKKR